MKCYRSVVTQSTDDLIIDRRTSTLAHIRSWDYNRIGFIENPIRVPGLLQLSVLADRLQTELMIRSLMAEQEVISLNGVRLHGDGGHA